MRALAGRLHITGVMSRLFLSGQMTCALLLGAGLLLRAQAALRPEPAAQTSVAIEATQAPQAPQIVHKTSQPRKPVAQRLKRPRGRRCGVALAGRPLRCG
jgi:hypothetical protein